MVAKGSPDWLPSGWTVQYKVQKTGRKIRFYMDMESGKSFFSKDDVISYIRNMQRQKTQPTSRRIKAQSGNSPVQLMVKTNEHPEWLPDGWKMESRTRMSGSNVGSVYRCYIDPMTGNRFYSKPEVFRYLRSVKNKLCTLKERRTSNNTSSRSQVVIEHYKDEDLPPGWIKEIKIREKADGIRKDPFYIDPKTGYVFRSKKDVLRYLETGEVSRHAFKPKEGGDDLELVDDKIALPSTAKGHKLEHSAEMPQISSGKDMSKGSSLELTGDQFPQMGQSEHKSAELKDAFDPPVETAQKIVLPQEVVRDSPGTNEKDSLSAALPIVEHPESNKTVRVSPDCGPVSTSASVSNQEQALPKAENPESNKTEVISPDSSKLLQENMIGHMIGKNDTGESKTKSRKYKKKDTNLPRRASKRLAGLEPELVSNGETREVPAKVSNGDRFPGVNVDVDLSVNANEDKACPQLDVRPERGNEGHPSNLMDSPLHGDPSNKRKTPVGCSLDAPELQMPSVQTEKLDDGELEAQFCVPIPEFWSDPCLEFAIKTLTGALPVENAAAATEGSVSYPTVDFLLEKSSQRKRPGSCVNKKTQVNRKLKNKKEPSSNRPSPSINGLKPELASDVMSCEPAIVNSNEAALSINFADSLIHEEPPYKNDQCKPSWKTEPLRDVNTEQQSTKMDEDQENQMVLENQHHTLQMDQASLETPLSFPFGDTWSDPCLDFAFKTLTGAIPIEDSLGIQSFFEERLESSRSQKDGNLLLPDFGSPSCFQNDISSHFEGPEKSVAGQHLSLDPFLPMGNVSLPNCSGFASQQPCFDRNRTYKGR